MKLSVHSIEKTLFQGEVDKITAKTSAGEITVLNGHIPLISNVLGPSIIISEHAGSEKVIPLQGGVIEVRPESETIILVN